MASLYGYSGASADTHDHTDNEKLVAAAIVRIKQMKGVPYYLCIDLNINPACSKTVQLAIEAQVINDIVDDACGGHPMATYKKLLPQTSS